MNRNVAKEVAALQRLTMHELRAKYAKLFGEGTVTGNRQWLVRRIAWRLQALVEGGLSERAQRRAAELANDADLRLSLRHLVLPQVIKARLLIDILGRTSSKGSR